MSSSIGLQLDDLVGLAVRRNARRAHLLVSTVLGKHVPTDPRLVYGTGLILGCLALEALRPVRTAAPLDPVLGELVRRALAGEPGAAGDLVVESRRVRRNMDDPPPGTVVLGFAETATALGHAAADALDVPVLHSTRRDVVGVGQWCRFEEEHSHATTHYLLPDRPDLLAGPGALVLVDDELSTGRTARNTIAAVHAVAPRARYVIAALVDLRDEAARAETTALADQLGVGIDVVSLVEGRVDLPVDARKSGAALVRELGEGATSSADATAPHPCLVTWLTGDEIGGEVRGVREGGRHGFTPHDRQELENHLAEVAREVSDVVPPGRIHVLGFEELMYAPLRLAECLAERHPDRAVTFSTTTRSPVLVCTDAGYAIRTQLAFPAHDDPTDGPGPRYAYNISAALAPGGAVVLVIDRRANRPELHEADGLVTPLRHHASHLVVVTLAEYRPEDVDA